MWKPRAGDEPLPCVRQALRLDWQAILPRANESIIIQADAQFQQLLRLPGAPCPKLGRNLSRQGDLAAAATFGRLVAHTLAGLLGTLDHGELRSIKVNTTPFQRRDLPTPQAAQASQQRRQEDT